MLLDQGVGVATAIAESQAAWAILFISLLGIVLWYVKTRFETVESNNQTLHNERQNFLLGILKENKAESKAREQELMSHNKSLVEQTTRMNDSLEEINRTQMQMQSNLAALQEGVTEMNQNIKHLQTRVEIIEQKGNK